MTPMEDLVSCPICGNYEVTPTTKPDEAGNCEYRCGDCGEYFVGKAQADSGNEAQPAEVRR